jgi:hypothetical protein
VIVGRSLVFMINKLGNMNNTTNHKSFRMYPGAGPLPEAPVASLPTGLNMLIVGWPQSM